LAVASPLMELTSVVLQKPTVPLSQGEWARQHASIPAGSENSRFASSDFSVVLDHSVAFFSVLQRVSKTVIN
jgi:hypothetical protein